MLLAIAVMALVLAVVMGLTELRWLFTVWIAAVLLVMLILASWWPILLILVPPGIVAFERLQRLLDRQDARLPDEVKEALRQDAINNALAPPLTGFGL